ncbi:hypothetical protein ACWCPX_42230 [Streptomyces olivaceoviridis]
MVRSATGPDSYHSSASAETWTPAMVTPSKRLPSMTAGRRVVTRTRRVGTLTKWLPTMWTDAVAVTVSATQCSGVTVGGNGR